MKRRNSAAVLAWGVPLVAMLGAAAVTSDVDVFAPPTLAHEALPYGSVPAAPEPPPPSATTVTVPRLTPAITPRAAPTTTLVASHPPGAGTRLAVVASGTARPAPSEPPATEDAQSIAPQATEYILDIPAIDLSVPVVSGDQAEIDAGNVTAVDWTAYDYPASCLPGEPCTVWLAGHRTTHGAVFARLPELTVGVPITIHFQGHDYAYTVNAVDTVPGSAPPSVIHGALVLQTSVPGDRRLLIYADGV